MKWLWHPVRMFPVYLTGEVLWIHPSGRRADLGNDGGTVALFLLTGPVHCGTYSQNTQFSCFFPQAKNWKRCQNIQPVLLFLGSFRWGPLVG